MVARMTAPVAGGVPKPKPRKKPRRVYTPRRRKKAAPAQQEDQKKKVIEKEEEEEEEEEDKEQEVEDHEPIKKKHGTEEDQGVAKEAVRVSRERQVIVLLDLDDEEPKPARPVSKEQHQAGDDVSPNNNDDSSFEDGVDDSDEGAPTAQVDDSDEEQSEAQQRVLAFWRARHFTP